MSFKSVDDIGKDRTERDKAEIVKNVKDVMKMLKPNIPKVKTPKIPWYIKSLLWTLFGVSLLLWINFILANFWLLKVLIKSLVGMA